MMYSLLKLLQVAVPIYSGWNVATTTNEEPNPYCNDLLIINMNGKIQLLTGNRVVCDVEIDLASFSSARSARLDHADRVGRESAQIAALSSLSSAVPSSRGPGSLLSPYRTRSLMSTAHRVSEIGTTR